MKKAPHMEGLERYLGMDYCSWPLLSQRFSMRSLKDERERGFFAALVLEGALKLEIALITPPRAMMKPKTPITGIFDPTPPINVASPRRTSTALNMMRWRLGEDGLAESAETRRGSSVKRAASISSSKRFSRSDSGTGSQ